MSLRATINVHCETAPMNAEVRDCGSFSVALVLSEPSDYGELTLFFPVKHKERVEKITTLLNEIMAPEPTPAESEDA